VIRPTVVFGSEGWGFKSLRARCLNQSLTIKIDESSQLVVRPGNGVDTQTVPILVVSVFGWHGAILDPLVKRLRHWRNVDYSSSHAIAQGWRPDREPRLVIVCDIGVVVHGLRNAFPSALFMHIGHGLISKNVTRHYPAADFVCAASDQSIERFTQSGHIPRKQFFATGFIQTDPLFRATDPLFRSLSKSRRVPGSSYDSTIIYAPTWNRSLNSAEMFGDTLVEKIRGQNDRIRIVIKPHPHINVAFPEWIEMWSRMSRQMTNVELRDPDSDLVPALLEADAMVSDASSAIFQFVILNRPIVLVNNPARFMDAGAFDPTGIEWLWRDIADEVDDVEDVCDAVRQALAHPDHRESQRLLRRRQLFGDFTDGRSCERVHSAVVHVLEKFL
jgi:hypothetical protein